MTPDELSDLCLQALIITQARVRGSYGYFHIAYDGFHAHYFAGLMAHVQWLWADYFLEKSFCHQRFLLPGAGNAAGKSLGFNRDNIQPGNGGLSL